MKEKLEKELETLKKQRDSFVTQANRLKDGYEKSLQQIVACNGGIQTLEKMLKEE